jgi:inward rectifier potassium channel
MANQPNTPSLPEDPNRDLGFGAVVARESRQRLLNKDGSFNVVREGLGPLASLSLYHDLLTMTWPRFLGLIVLFYLGANAVFAAAYMACGPGALAGATAVTPGGRFLESFFFSVHTFATIGYGSMSPHSLAANFLVIVESLVGLLGFALATGILFSRFARPTAQILFSKYAIIAPFKGITAFEFRIANARSNQLIELQAKVLLSWFKPDAVSREFYPLRLEREKVVFFPLSWTIVHPIDEESPLWGITPEQLTSCEAEILILLTGIDETFSQTVHSRSSYTGNEVLWGVRFANLFNPPTPDGVLSIDISRLNEVEPAPIPRPAISGTAAMPAEIEERTGTG